MNKYHCGFVALIGRPNVGKSTLLNHLLGRKISITSRKPQTTRQRILGIQTEGDYQSIYVDTPGLHRTTPHALNKYMNKVALQAVRSVDVILFVTEGMRWTEEDQFVFESIKKVNIPVLWIINKIDQITDKEALLPHIERISSEFKFATVIPLCARRVKDIARLSTTVQEYLPDATEFLYPIEQVTDKPEYFMGAELIRESLLTSLGEEVPHMLTVIVEKIEHKPEVVVVHGLIYVERDGHKAIVIGKKGERLKAIGQQARLSLETYFQKKVFLQLWVKVRPGWLDDTQALKQLGYGEE